MADGERLRSFWRFVDAVLQLPAVRKIGWGTPTNPWALWVLLEREALDQHERVHDLVYDYAQTPGAYRLDVRVVALDRVDESMLPAPKMTISR